jgi:molecular chaperone DnaK
MLKHALGIDFGTANTYLSECSNSDTSTVPVLLEDSIGKATANLYRQQKKQIELFLIGQLAINTYGTTPAHIRKQQGMSLQTQYKPDIGRSRASRDFAEDYFKKLLEDYNGIEAQEVIFGIPSEADDRFKDALKVVALSTGFAGAQRPVKMFPEPLGALVYHLSQKNAQLSPGHLGRGSLILDFGGGTCDFTAMNKFLARHSWGDMLLGGRLFDDLFYQAFLSQNSTAKSAIEAKHDQHYIQFHECKLAKEEFSNLMQREKNRDCTFTRSIRPYGTLIIEGWEHFEKLARCYRPSENIQVHFPDPCEETIDLLDWFEGSLRKGLIRLQEEQASGGIELALLTGGSSRWPFVKEIVEKVLNETQSHGASTTILVSASPYIDVGEGLSMIPAARKFASADVDRLNHYLCADAAGLSKLDGTIESLVERATADVSEVAGKANQRAFQTGANRLRKEFQKNGGRLSSFTKKLKQSIYEADHDSELLAKTLSQWEKSLPELTRSRIMEELGRELRFPVHVRRPLSFSGLDYPDNNDWVNAEELGDSGSTDPQARSFPGILTFIGSVMSWLILGLAFQRWGLGLVVAALIPCIITAAFRLPVVNRLWRSLIESIPWAGWMVRVFGMHQAFDSLAAEIRKQAEEPKNRAWQDFFRSYGKQLSRDFRQQLDYEIDARKALSESLSQPCGIVEGW